MVSRRFVIKQSGRRGLNTNREKESMWCSEKHTKDMIPDVFERGNCVLLGGKCTRR